MLLEKLKVCKGESMEGEERGIGIGEWPTIKSRHISLQLKVSNESSEEMEWRRTHR